MSFTNYLEDQILDSWFGGKLIDTIIPDTLYIGLSTTAPSEAGGNITEPGGFGYARAAVANTAANFPNTGGDGTKSNGATIEFAQATGDWGTVSHFFIADAATGGNVLAFGSLGTPKTIGNGDTASFGQGSLTITLD